MFVYPFHPENLRWDGAAADQIRQVVHILHV
jgi:hypothetical protein